jgi:hypothetical protein
VVYLQPLKLFGWNYVYVGGQVWDEPVFEVEIFAVVVNRFGPGPDESVVPEKGHEILVVRCWGQGVLRRV